MMVIEASEFWPGSFPEWLSGVSAAAALLGVIWLTFFVGRRADLSVSAVVAETDHGLMLTATVGLHAISRWRLRTLKRLPCELHGCAARPNGDALGWAYETWNAAGNAPDPSALRPSLHGLDGRTLKRKVQRKCPRLRRESFHWRRRLVWACPNQKAPRLRIEEIRVVPGDAPEGNAAPRYLQAKVISDLRNVLRGEFVEPGEHASYSHLFDLGMPSDDVVGWHVVAEVWAVRRDWWRQPIETDCWSWTAATHVVRPASVTPAPDTLKATTPPTS